MPRCALYMVSLGDLFFFVFGGFFFGDGRRSSLQGAWLAVCNLGYPFPSAFKICLDGKGCIWRGAMTPVGLDLVMMIVVMGLAGFEGELCGRRIDKVSASGLQSYRKTAAIEEYDVEMCVDVDDEDEDGD